MTIYGKGNWTRFSVDPDHWERWTSLLGNPRRLFEASAFAARSVLLANADTDSVCGINPPCWPCGDAPYPQDQADLDRKIHPWIARGLADDTNLTPWEVPESVQDELGIALEGDRYWGTYARHFQLLGDGENVIGFWMVLMKRETLDDLNALKEHSAAIMWGSPFKRLPSADRTAITKELTESGELTVYVSRCQCPVILDFNQGSIWLGTTSKKLVDAFRFWMGHYLQIPVSPMSLILGGNHDWPSLALQAFRDGDIFKLERQEALEDLLREDSEDAAKEEEVTPGDTPAKEMFRLDNLAVYSKDNVRSCTVGVDAAVLPLPQRHSSAVATKGAAEALTILNVVQGSTVGAAKATFQDVIAGEFVKASVDLNAFLVGGVYRGLDLTFTSKAEKVFLQDESPVAVFPENEGDSLPPKMNRHWFAYYLWLMWAERLIIDVCCEALDLDPSLVAMRKADPEQATPAEEAVIRSAVTSSEVEA